MTRDDRLTRIIEEFTAAKPLYERLARAIHTLLEQLAIDKGVSVFLIESRVKDQNSVEEKTQRPEKDGKYTSTNDITDICGIRIVLYTNEDCATLTAAVRETFSVDEGNSITKGIDYDPDRFGYLSTHLVVSLSDIRLRLFEYRDLSALKAEIQIRTVLQHAWAVLDWKLRYKSNVEVPRELRRKLYRISALLEAADDAFSDLQISSVELRQEYENNIENGRLLISINKDSLKAFVINSPLVASVFTKCSDYGILIQRQTVSSETPWTYLINSLNACNISNLYEFEHELQQLSDENYKTLKGISDIYQNAFGVFTSLRILMISRLPEDQRLRVVKDVRTNARAGKAERAYFTHDDAKIRLLLDDRTLE